MRESIPDCERPVESDGLGRRRHAVGLRLKKVCVEAKRPEIEAVAVLLRSELQKESKRSFLNNFLVNLFFFGLGVIATLAMSAMGVV